MKVGLIFGSFNPCHLGHLYLAEEALKAHNLDEVWFMLQVSNPYKDQTEIQSIEDRQAMLRLLASANARLRTHVVSTPHIAQTVGALEQHYKHAFYPIFGSDLASTLPSWPDYQDIKQLNLITLPRKEQYSSHLIRAHLSQSKQISEYVPPAIEHYIRQKRLYVA